LDTMTVFFDLYTQRLTRLTERWVLTTSHIQSLELTLA
jgi:hypothetical protein